MLTYNEKQEILSRFPIIKLSYENITHKKVNIFNYIVAIPSGIKAFAWFSVYRNKKVCYILETLNKQNIYIVTVSGSSQLNYGIGTILYGTVLNSNSFCLEEIFYYKGKHIINRNFTDKLYLFQHIFKNDIGVSPFMNFGLPIIDNKIEKLKNAAYKVSHVKYICENCVINVPFVQFPINREREKMREPEREQELIFKVKPHIQNDIYMLYTYHNSTDNYYYGLAYIPDYKTSVMMNTIFRNIKENFNLDKLEESDSEEEFENEKNDKYVYLDKSANMICHYNHKFKKWVPIKLAEKGARIISQKEMEKNKY